MSLQPQILFRDIPHSDAIEDHIKSRIEKLRLFCNEIMHCDVEVCQAQKHNRTGKLYQTRIFISVPHKEIVVNHHMNEDVYVCLRDSFDAARRQLKAYMGKKRGEIKTHEPVVMGTISNILPFDEVGFIQALGNDYYFTKDSLSAVTFDKLSVGMIVHFIPNVDEIGYRANRVSVGKNENKEGKH